LEPLALEAALASGKTEMAELLRSRGANRLDNIIGHLAMISAILKQSWPVVGQLNDVPSIAVSPGGWLICEMVGGSVNATRRYRFSASSLRRIEIKLDTTQQFTHREFQQDAKGQILSSTIPQKTKRAKVSFMAKIDVTFEPS
jgi:hypothetical protein